MSEKKEPITSTSRANFFLDERLMRNVALLSVACSVVSIVLMGVNHNLGLLDGFEKLIKIIITLLTLWTFSKFHWDAMQGLMGALLFSLLYQESFLVLGRLWGETSDFDAYLIMGVQGSLYLAAQSMSFLMTVFIIINHFVIDYGRQANYGNVIFNQITIVFKIFLYVFLMVINMFLNQTMLTQINAGFEFLSDLCIVVLVICIETQLDSFKAFRQELKESKKQKEEING